MASMNRVFLLGNLASDPRGTVTSDGMARVTFRLVVNTRFSGKSPTEKVETCFVDVVVWGALARDCYDSLVQGSRVLVEGRLVYSEWMEKESGKRLSKTSVTATRVLFLDAKGRQVADRSAGRRESTCEEDPTCCGAGLTSPDNGVPRQ